MCENEVECRAPGRTRVMTTPSRSRTRGEFTLVWPNGLHFTRLHPVKSASGGNIVNKGGRIVLRGELNNKPIKLYEAWSPEHAAFIDALAKATGIGELFPAVDAHNGRSVAASWVQGHPPDDVPLDTLVEIQMRIHSTNAVVLPTPGYDFWMDFLRPRFVRSEMLAATIDDTLELVDSEMSLPSVRMLVHPDLRPANLIRTASGSLVVVDNESVTTIRSRSLT